MPEYAVAELSGGSAMAAAATRVSSLTPGPVSGPSRVRCPGSSKDSVYTAFKEITGAR